MTEKQKYKLIHHFDFPPGIHYSSISKKNYISCNENWIEIPTYITELDQIEIIEPDETDESDYLYIFLAE